MYTTEEETETNVAYQALKSRVCYVVQTIVFSVAVVGLVIFLTIDYVGNTGDLETSENEEKVNKICELNKVVGDDICDDNANVFECKFDGGDCCWGFKGACLKCDCYITSYSTSTLPPTTASTVTDNHECYECPEWGVLYMPSYLRWPPIEMRTGKYEDCSNLCLYNQWRCKYFLFFSDKFQGPMKNMCVLYEERVYEKYYMPGVISGRIMEYYEDII